MVQRTFTPRYQSGRNANTPRGRSPTSDTIGRDAGRGRATTRPTRRQGNVGTAGQGTAAGATILAECIEACNETLAYCLEQGGDHAERGHILGLIDCIDSCWYVSGLQARDSDLVGDALQLCATACKNCEESCEEFEGDETMKRCEDVARACYEYCSR